MFNITFKLELATMLVVVSLALASLTHAAQLQVKPAQTQSIKIVACTTDTDCAQLNPQIND